MGDARTIRLVCARCRGALGERGEELHCARCAVAFPRTGGIADFVEGRYYDDFPGPEVLSAENRRGLANESEGARIEGFYLPLLDRIASERGVPRAQIAVLDSGCGNGESVDVLSRFGFEAWGHDLSALRKWQWRERERRDRLVVAAGETLPFPGDAFDAVIASGVLEHVGSARRAAAAIASSRCATAMNGGGDIWRSFSVCSLRMAGSFSIFPTARSRSTSGTG